MSDKEKQEVPGTEKNHEPQVDGPSESSAEKPDQPASEEEEREQEGGDSSQEDDGPSESESAPEQSERSEEGVEADEEAFEEAEEAEEAAPTVESGVPVWELDEDMEAPELDEDSEEETEKPSQDSGPVSREEKLKRLQRKNRKKNEDNVPRAVVDAVKKRVEELTETVAERDARLAEAAEQLQQGQAEIEAVAEERDEIQNRLLRTAADLENFRRRAEREKEELKRYGIDKVVLELIPAVDNMERALEHAQVKETEGSNSFIDGVRMVYRQILTALEKHGVTGFESVGERFDPERHEAIQQVETTEYDTGVVVEQYQKGYFLHDRLLRPAMVSVAKRIEAPQDEGTEEEADEQEPQGQSVDPEADHAESHELDGENKEATGGDDEAPPAS